MMTSSTSLAAMRARSTAARIAAAPRAGAGTDFNAPWKPPRGVRAADAITTGSDCMLTPALATNALVIRQPSCNRVVASLRITNHESRITNHESRITNHESRITKLRGFLKQLPTDQPAPDFRSASADFVQLRIAQQSTRRTLVDIAHSAQRLYGFKRHPRCALSGIQYGTGRILAGHAAGIASARDAIHVCT